MQLATGADRGALTDRGDEYLVRPRQDHTRNKYHSKQGRHSGPNPAAGTPGEPPRSRPWRIIDQPSKLFKPPKGRH